MFKKSQDHLKEMNESYFVHMLAALKISITMIIGGILAFVHAILPSICKTSASVRIKNLNNLIDKRLHN